MKKELQKIWILALCSAVLAFGENGEALAQEGPSNDLCAMATEIPVNVSGECTSFIAGDNTLASYEGGYFNCVPGPDVFFRFNSGQYAAIQLNLTIGTMEYLVLEVLDGCGGATVSCTIAANTPDPFVIQVTPNTEYIVRISSTIGPQGTFSICLSGIECPVLGLNIGDSCDDGNPATVNDLVHTDCTCSGIVSPVNDNCSEAIPLTINGGAMTGDNTNAAPDGPLMNCAFENDDLQHDIWFSFVAPETGILKIETSYSVPIELSDTQIQVMDACGEGAEVIGCDEDGGEAVYSLIRLGCGAYIPGEMYYIQVDGYNGEVGTFNISITSEICENSAMSCSDGIDNDNDGLIDCEDPECQALNNNMGCITCFDDGTSFADQVIEYNNTCLYNTKTNQENALGTPDYDGVSSNSYVSLGEGGFIKLKFIDNTLVNSGNSDSDIYIFEVGPSIETVSIELRPLNSSTEAQLISAGIQDLDNDGYYEFGIIGESTATLDIDAFFSSVPYNSLQFDAVKIKDVPSADCIAGSPGADIDGVCAMSSIVTCGGVDLIPITVDGDVVTGDNTGLSPLGPTMACAFSEDALQHVSWFSFVAPSSGVLTIETSPVGSPALYDTQIQVVDGCDEGAEVLACDDDSGDNFQALAVLECGSYSPGTTYFIQVDGFGNQTGAFNISVTSAPCSATAMLSGQVNWNPSCGDREATVKLFEPGTAILWEHYDVSVDLNGNFTIDSIPTGTFDVFVKVEGYLQKGLADINVDYGENILEVGAIIGGDANNDNSANVIDASIINAGFFTTIGDSNFNPLCDFNCDGTISIIDISSFNISYGQIGDTPPLIIGLE